MKWLKDNWWLVGLVGLGGYLIYKAQQTPVPQAVDPENPPPAVEGYRGSYGGG